MRFTLPLKKVALACNSCAGWVGGAGNLIAVPAVNIIIYYLLLFFTLQHCVSGDIRDLVKERWYKSLHADRLTPTTGVAEELLHKLKYLYKDSYS